MSGVFVLEFNELNLEAMQRLAERGRLPNFSRLLQSGRLVRTTVSEEYSKLEPWIQWVSAHSGKCQADHKAFNLSDVQHTQLKQIWEVLEAQGLPCGVVSPMNARRGAMSMGFFIPDPWSVSLDTYPVALEPVYRFLAERVQSHNVSLERGGSKLAFARSCLRAGMPLAALGRIGLAYVVARLDRRKKWRLAAELDRFLVELTLVLRDLHKTEYTSVFLNGVAHYQHHYWTAHEPDHWRKKYPNLFDKRNPVADENLRSGDDPIAYGLEIYDSILGRAIATVGAESVMVVTGLSQIPFEGYEGGTGFYLYRPFDHEKLFDAIGLQRQRVAPLMSRDAMLYFDDDVQRAAGALLLRSARVLGQPLFACSEETESRLFCKVTFTFDAPAGTSIEAHGIEAGELKFGDLFQLITFKTGHHCSEGFLIAPENAFARGALPPATIPLEQFPTLVLRMMRISDPEQVAQSLALSPL